MTFAVVIIIAVYLPILFLQGLEGTDVPADGDHRLRGAVRIAAAGADVRAGAGVDHLPPRHPADHGGQA